MRTCIRSSCFLILFTIFSISILLSSAVAQSLPVVQGTYGSPSLPIVQGTYGSPPGQGLSPSQSALEAAKRAKQEAEQQVTTAQSALEQANAAKVAAEEQLASAQTALETATAAEQAALAANAEQLQVAEQAQKDAEQQLASAQTTLDSANTKLQELEQQVADARTKVADASEAKRLAEQALAKAVNEVRQIKGEPALPVIGGNNTIGFDNVAFKTITPKLVEHDCKEQLGTGDPQIMVDGNPQTNFTCNGLFRAKFSLAEKMVIDAVNVQSEHEFPSFTGNTVKIYVDDKEVAEQDIPAHCETCELTPTRVDIENIEGQLITIELTKALPNEKNAIESEIAEVSVVAGIK